MADPFSIIIGTVGLIDVCLRFGAYLNNVQAGAAQIEDEIASLSREIEALTSVNETIQASYKEFQSSSSADASILTQMANLWRNIESNLHDCRIIVEDLEQLVIVILGKETQDKGSKFSRKLDGFRKQLRKQSKEGDFNKLHSRLNTYQNTLQLMLDLVILTHARQTHSVATESLEEFKLITGKSLQEIKNSLVSLQSTITSQDAKSLHDSLGSAETVVSLASVNEHFSVPHGAEKLYTGRSNVLAEVKHAFAASIPEPALGRFQKRIVIYGLGGSGKTQFCCEYAQRYRHSYWGIFWINASSDELAKQTYQDIAKVGGVGDNVRAAKYWLSNLKTQWLLIIDNADNSEIQLDNYIPDGERGHILITTRIPSNKTLGTVGPQYLHFEGLKDDDANTLLLKAASKPVPGDTCSQGFAASITKALGSLPLALLHAGKAIMKRLCTLENYLQYYQREKDNVRRARDFRGFQKGDNIYMNVYSSFEINFRGLQSKGTTEAQDAIQLLQMFSFFHRENIRMDFLIKAATNPKIEREEQEKEQAKQKAIPKTAKTRSWTTIFRDMALEVAMLIYKDRSSPVLPHLLRDSSEFERLGDFRLRAALNELTQLSLITYNEVNDSYSMHPVVHTWARERPEFSATEQAVWCQAATTALAQCILLPPLANGEADERLRHELLPHIDHVRERQREIRQRINEAQKSRKTTLLLSKPTMTRTQVTQLARFSRVYAQGGRWDEAKGLQLTVKEFCSKMLGDEHPSTMRIKLALSGTNWQLGRGNEAAELQNQVLQAYTASLGDDHPDTLKVMDVLGESRWQQGRYTDSEKLHERALKGMTEVLGSDHEDTLKAMDNLGRAHASHWRTEKARELHSKAAAGMRKNSKLGPNHLETLTAVNNLAMTYMEYGGDAHSSESELQQAHQLLLEVIKSREIKLGKEHPYTLWAAANLARVKCTQGYMAEAESDILAGLKIAERNLGPTHIGTLFGKLHLGDILIKQERLADAEEILLEVADGHRNMSVANKGEHPDRVKALDFLSTCYQLQDRLGEAVDICGQAIDGLAALGGHAHPYMKRLRDKHMGLCELRTAPQSKIPLRTMSVSEPPPPYRE